MIALITTVPKHILLCCELLLNNRLPVLPRPSRLAFSRLSFTRLLAFRQCFAGVLLPDFQFAFAFLAGLHPSQFLKPLLRQDPRFDCLFFTLLLRQGLLVALRSFADLLLASLLLAGLLLTALDFSRFALAKFTLTNLFLAGLLCAGLLFFPEAFTFLLCLLARPLLAALFQSALARATAPLAAQFIAFDCVDKFRE